VRGPSSLTQRLQRLTRRLLSVPIFWKVLGIGVLVAALFGTVTLWQTHTMTSRILQRDLGQHTLEVARSLSIELERPLLTDDILAIQWQLNRYLKMFPEVRYIVVRDSEGNVEGHTFHNGVPQSLREAYPVSVAPTGLLRIFSSPEGPLFDAVYPILGNQAGQVELALTNKSILGDISLLSRSVVWTLLFCVVVGTGLAWGLTEILARPINFLDRAARTVGQGEFSAHAEVFYEDEIGRLATTFNEMTANLRKYRQEILEKEKNRLSLLDKIVRAQEEERRTISRELHDQVGQSLSALLLEFHSGCQKKANSECICVGRCLALEEKLRAMIEEVRRLAWNMRPSILDDYGLDSALARYAEEMSRQSGIPIDYQCLRPPEGHRLPWQVETTCYRIAQEAVVNAIRHSAAARASIIVVWNHDAMTLLVEDNGRGFDSGAAVHDGLHNLGLTGMRERAGLIGGSCIVESQLGKGTVVRVQIPLREEGVPCLSVS
jgi:signal transduction histidine kinase